MQAAIGCSQLEKIQAFTEKRNQNYTILYSSLEVLKYCFYLPQPTRNCKPSWFGFWLTLKDDVGFKRNEIVEWLESRNIQTRNLFAGNIIRHPCFTSLKEGSDYQIVGGLKNTDKIMNDSFWIGLYPGMTREKIDYIVSCIKEFVSSHI